MEGTVFTGVVSIGFCVFLLGIGKLYSGMRKNSESFFLAGHGNKALMLTVCTVMGWIGTGELVGTYGSGLQRLNLTPLFYSLGFALALPFYAFVLCKRAYRIGNHNNLYTISDFFRLRYGKGAALAFSVFSILRNCILLSGQGLGCGVMLNLFFEIPVPIGTALSLAVVYGYVSMGGLKAAMVTTFWQWWACVLGVVLVTFLGVNRVGGFTALLNAMPENFNLNPLAGRSFWEVTGGTLPTFFSCFTYNAFYVRCFSSKNEREMQKACIYSALVMCCYLVVTAIGIMVCIALVPSNLETPDHAIYHLLGLLNPYLTAFFSAALLSAAMTCADETMIGSGAMFTKSVYQVFLKPNATDEHLIKVNNITMGAYCLIGWAFTLVGGNLFDIIRFALSLLNGAFPVLISAWFWPRMNNAGAIAGFTAGGVTAIIWRFSSNAAEIMPALWASGIASFVAMVIFSYMTPPPGKETVEFMASGNKPFVRNEQTAG